MLGRNGLQIAVCIWVSYVTSSYVTSCRESRRAGGGGGGGEGGGGMVQYIFTIRKQHSVNKVHSLRYSVSKISEYKSRCCFFLLF